MGTNEKLVPGELLIMPVFNCREIKIVKITMKLASSMNKINEEMTHV